MQKINLNNKWIFSESVNLKEQTDEKGNTKYYLETKMIPFGEISRNKIKYNEESVRNTHQNLIGKSLNHNHTTDGADVLPRGEWLETFIKDDGMYAIAEVYNTKYNEAYLEWLRNCKNPRVSLQVNGSAESRNDNGETYKEAYIEDWLEGSTVIVPGFDDAKGSFTMAIKESFKEQAQHEVNEDDFFNNLKNVRKESHLNVNDIIDINGESMKVVEILDNGYKIEYLNEEEDFFEQLKKHTEKYENIPDHIIDKIVIYLKKNKNKNVQQLQKEIHSEFGYLIDFSDIKDYTRLF